MYSESDDRELTSPEKAAQGHKGQDQAPVQSEESSSSTWDTLEHSKAPGPFGTGDDEKE